MHDQILIPMDKSEVDKANRMIASSPLDFRVPFAYGRNEAGQYRDMGGFMVFTGLSWDFFGRTDHGEPCRATLHAELREWATRTDPKAKPVLREFGRLNIEIDFAELARQLPPVRTFVHRPEGPEKACISRLELFVADANPNTRADFASVNWGQAVDPEQDWRADAMRACLQTNSETLFWLLQQAGALAGPKVTALAEPVPVAVSTLGFDLVFTTTMTQVNRDLAANSERLAAEFSYRDDERKLEMSGRLGTWQITRGSSGTLINLTLPIVAGRLTVQGRLGNEAIDLSGLTVTVQTDLTLVPSASDPGQHELRFAFQAGQAEGGQLATVIKVDGPARQVEQAAEWLKAHLPQCLDANAEAMTYVLATVSIAKPGSDSWLAPARCAFCFAQPQGMEETFVALLGSQNNVPIRPQDLRVDPAAFGDILHVAPDAGVLVLSKDVYLRKVLQPALQRIFPGTSPETFSFDSSAQTIVNMKPFGLRAVSAGAGTYHPVVKSLEVRGDHGALITNLSGSCDMGLNITLHFSALNTCLVKFDKASQSFSFQADAHPDITSHVDIPWYDYFLLLAGIPGLIIAGIQTATLFQITDAVRGGNLNFSPAKSGAYSVKWSGMRDFEVNDAGFSGSFYMRGRVQ
ncbi:TULIP family P47-like protein [Sedimenticola hydrogenitrophicus]|uniref:TULIP family P47-like protein n=1 Tax=Sedimenticola hydrogenitrophicus TaxID=2967975 RepID=UPI0023B18F08|nr:TULIP family P47-like protein [Sedimenticola hydrogenitrophicus]